MEVPVHHRPRSAGRTKYGIWNRAIPGLIDCIAVRWMWNRRRPVEWVRLEPEEGRPGASAEVEIIRSQQEAGV